ncbi:MAG: methyltransferase domain-containing protein, partial [Candidatus Hydrothermae bacterium]|nr:methyltransferase domain-containing protein [Candidatus Hydrothermae bacterium]
MAYKFPPESAPRLLDPDRAAGEELEQWWPLLDLRPGQRVLDLGTGPGFYLPYVLQSLKGQGTVVAADLSPGMLQMINLRSVLRVRIPETELPFQKASFDRILAAHVLHEFEHPVARLQEIRRVLRAGGRLWIWDWHPRHIPPPGPPTEERVDPARALAWCAQAQLTPRLV